MKRLKVAAMVFGTCVVADVALFGMAHFGVEPHVGALAYGAILFWGIWAAIGCGNPISTK